jgi:hypothetical protein
MSASAAITADNVPIDDSKRRRGILAALSAVNVPKRVGDGIEWDVRPVLTAH